MLKVGKRKDLRVSGGPITPREDEEKRRRESKKEDKIWARVREVALRDHHC